MDDHTYIFEGKTTLKDFYKVLQINEILFDDDKFEAETLAGLILEITGKFPKKKDSIKYKGYTFEIEAIDKKRIKQVKVNLSTKKK